MTSCYLQNTDLAEQTIAFGVFERVIWKSILDRRDKQKILLSMQAVVHYLRGHIECIPVGLRFNTFYFNRPERESFSFEVVSSFEDSCTELQTLDLIF